MNLASRSGSCSALIAALLLAACGGEDKGRPSPDIVQVPPQDQCALLEKYEIQPLINFEPRPNQFGGDDDHAVCDPSIPCEPGVVSPFYFNYDGAHTVTQRAGAIVIPAGNVTCPTSPAPLVLHPEALNDNAREVLVEPIPGGPRCGTSANALHLTAKNVGMCRDNVTGRLGWGAALDMNFDKMKRFDASAYDGIGLWVRRASADTSPAFILSVVDEQNEGVNQTIMSATPPQCGCRRPDPVGAPQNWICSNDPGPEYADVEKCDAYGATVTLTEEWSFMAISFAGLQQKGFGFASAPFDRSRVSRLQFLMTFGNWDFWIDDLVLYRKKP
ncbi:MAG: hypothetical protein ACOY0T_22950 [Myxococcota bacterium]